MRLGEKVMADGEHTEIIAIAYDECGVKIYNVAGSMKDYYEKELLKEEV